MKAFLGLNEVMVYGLVIQDYNLWQKHERERRAFFGTSLRGRTVKAHGEEEDLTSSTLALSLTLLHGQKPLQERRDQRSSPPTSLCETLDFTSPTPSFIKIASLYLTVCKTCTRNGKQSFCDPLGFDVVLMWKWMLLGKRGTRLVLQPAVSPQKRTL